MPEQKSSRALGITALLIALVPVVALAVVGLYPMVFPAPAESFGLLLLIGVILIYAVPLLAIVGLVLGIIAARRNRGRVAGIIAIVIASLLIVYGAMTLLLQLLVVLTVPQ